MQKDEQKKFTNENMLNEQPPDFDYPPPGEPVPLRRSFLLMRIMIIVVNLAAVILCRSFTQSWYSVHGTSPVWISIIFLLVPLGSLFFIYLYMGRIGYEKILKLICAAFCVVQIVNVFSPADTSQLVLGTEGFSSDYGYVTEAGSVLGISFPTEGSATTVDGTYFDYESETANFMASVKVFLGKEKLYSCTDVIYTDKQAEAFEKSVQSDPLWLREIPEKLDGLQFSMIDCSGYDYFLFFDCDDSKFNALPEDGKHTVYSVMYDEQGNSLQILKYTKKF